MDSAANGLGQCTMGCSHCQARAKYQDIALRYYKKGENMAEIARSLRVTRAYIWKCIQMAEKYGFSSQTMGK